MLSPRGFTEEARQLVGRADELTGISTGRTKSSTLQEMARGNPIRRRAKISISVDPALLNAVDRYVQGHASMDRSKVMEFALQHWYKARQDEAMTEQYSGSESADQSEQRSWREIRRSATSRKLKRPAP